jgi:hypothetical protein
MLRQQIDDFPGVALDPARQPIPLAPSRSRPECRNLKMFLDIKRQNMPQLPLSYLA